MNRLTWQKKICNYFALALVCVTSGAFAVTPPPDGGYPGNNTAEGTSALFSRTTGIDNTGLGFQALFHTTTGNFNTAQGFHALFFNTNGIGNTANGATALGSNTSGSQNTADGVNALVRNRTGSLNTADGVNALFSNTIGTGNTASGLSALYHNTTGEDNTAVGREALFSNTAGYGNTANGYDALYNNSTGLYNTANGEFALNGVTIGFDNIGIGYEAGYNVRTASYVIAIGAGFGAADVSNTTWIQNIYGVVTQNGAASPVYVSADGQLGTTPSSERFKKDIKPMNQNSQAILQLKPVTFHYKAGSEGVPQFGLIAEEVEKINPDLVFEDKEGKPFSVRYDAVNVMLLNEFLKEHKKVQDLAATVAKQQKGMEVLTAQLKEQAAQIQKVSARLEMNKPAEKLVVNKP